MTFSWVAGTGLALWLQHRADRSFDRYEALGDPGRRDREFDRAQRYDRLSVTTWAASELLFLVMLKDWLSAAE